jgi:methylated-DNA-[protein]-cysteine S-methyltransferase
VQGGGHLMSESTWWARLASPVGIVAVAVDEEGAVVRVVFGETSGKRNGRASEAAKQLDEYFRGERGAFDLDLRPSGTDFEKRVWAEVVKIPFGETATYGEIAESLDGTAVARAVGSANAANPIAILIPCHRVVGAGGELTGYAGGLWRKRWLLAHESGQQNLVF